MTAIGDDVELDFQVADSSGNPVDPSSATLTFRRPDGGTDVFALDQLTRNGIGDYSYAYPPAAGGPYGWTFQTADPGVVLQGTFAVDNTQVSPGADTGIFLSTSWVNADDVAGWPGMATVPRNILMLAARAASELLYVRSGRQFPGLATTTVRPTMQPYERNLAATAAWLGSYGYSFQGTWSPIGLGWGSHGWGSWRWPPAVDLGVYPLRSITQVKIDGVVIPPDEYRIDDHRWLSRVRPTISSEPTERYGWPATQSLDLPDTEESTFSVTCTYGIDPPYAGKLGAAALAAHIAGQYNQTSGRNLPTRTQSVTRSGVNIQIGDSLAWVAEGMTGVYEADVFIRFYNPSGATRRASVYSPDIGTSRRAGV